MTPIDYLSDNPTAEPTGWDVTELPMRSPRYHRIRNRPAYRVVVVRNLNSFLLRSLAL